MIFRLISSIFLCALSTLAFANPAPGKLYVSAFGGGGTSTDFNASQFGTAFF